RSRVNSFSRSSRSFRATNHSARETTSCPESGPAISGNTVCVLICSFVFISTTNEPIGSGRIFACPTPGVRLHIHYERLLRGVGILDSDCFGCVSSVGIIELELALVITILLIGFPIALILAWAYDITPRGIQSTPGIPGTHR